ncbi:hypothetical protein CKM354_000613700 [Cercospora kikuchii]|uniref:Prion-inhibition and propagation HeLo domain-containing protein n=1 Tax=Cercospora kikuchii TaxID=84275 RepID=A0A9P3CHB8_9PEZI|nr:uncharacterized protein CKM354_000613700 [Cercospora kikuchii]GIZ42889.1 hypothetical protein CKM354_000613700 [Cercospora kikuchii]
MAISFSPSVAGAWRACVNVFDIVGHSKRNGPEFELCRPKLEIERLRLLAWGDAVGFREFEAGLGQWDPRLQEEQIKKVVLQALGGIQQTFNDTKKLRSRYGLVQVSPNGDPAPSSGMKGWLSKAGAKVGRDRQQAATPGNMTVWAVNDKTKFQHMVQEIRQFNDVLVRLFPNLNFKDATKKEIGRESNVQLLSLLARASAEGDPDISDIIYERLVGLGVTQAPEPSPSQSGGEALTVVAGPTSKRNSGLSGIFGHRKTESSIRLPGKKPALPMTIEAAAASKDPDAALDALEKRLDVIKVFEDDLGTGALVVSLIGPAAWSAKTTAHVSWQGNEQARGSSFESRQKGFTKSQHAALDAYHKKKFIKKLKKSEYDNDGEEDGVFFDPETSPKYENVNTGTVTLEGFALEVWDYEEVYGIKRENTFLVSTATMAIPAERLLRRLEELRTETHRLGQNVQEDYYDLHDFLKSTTTWLDPARQFDPANELSELYASLNRDDIFSNFVHQSAVFIACVDQQEVWNFLLQMILGVELARRMQQYPNSWVSGLTARVLATLIVSDQWIKNVRVVLKPAPVPEEFKKIPNSAEDAAKADAYNREGETIMQQGKDQEAVDLFTKAIEIGGSNLVYILNRSGAYLKLSKHAEALYDAFIAKEMDPKSAKAWGCMGAALLLLNHLDPALEAYTTAVQLADQEYEAVMKSNLEYVKLRIQDWNADFDNTREQKLKHEMAVKMRDHKWNVLGQTMKFYSQVHESQVDGLLHFAERMRWPYTNEARVNAEEAYSKMHNGGHVNGYVADWLYGLTLPGKHFAFKIMATLIQCSPSVAKTLGVAKYLDSNVVLEKQSYWRARSAVGRVLGAMPGVKSLGGWIGPLPAVEISPSRSEPFKPLLVRLKARQIPPKKPVQAGDNTIYIGGRHDRYKYTKPDVKEDIDAYIADMTSNEAYTAPQPPHKSQSNVNATGITLKRLTAESGETTTTENTEVEAEYRASVTFSIDQQQDPVIYTLYTNPIFVTLPICYNGPHKVHRRELKQFQLVSWDAEKLSDHISEDDDDEGEDAKCMMINATGKGAEVLARAWCSERSKHAIVVREGGPCLVCAIRTAQSLEIKVIIWVG